MPGLHCDCFCLATMLPAHLAGASLRTCGVLCRGVQVMIAFVGDTSLTGLLQDFLSRMLSVGRYAKAPGSSWDAGKEPPHPSGCPPAIRTGYPAHPSGAVLAARLPAGACCTQRCTPERLCHLCTPQVQRWHSPWVGVSCAARLSAVLPFATCCLGLDQEGHNTGAQLPGTCSLPAA